MKERLKTTEGREPQETSELARNYGAGDGSGALLCPTQPSGELVGLVEQTGQGSESKEPILKSGAVSKDKCSRQHKRVFTANVFLGVSKIPPFGEVASQTESENVFDVVPELTSKSISVRQNALAF